MQTARAPAVPGTGTGLHCHQDTVVKECEMEKSGDSAGATVWKERHLSAGRVALESATET